MKHLTGNRGWDGWMASLTQWTWVWANWETVEDREAWCAMGVQHGITKNGMWLSDWTMTTALKWEPPKFHCLTCKPDPWCLSSRNLLSKTTYYQKKKKKKTLYKREFRNVIGASGKCAGCWKRISLHQVRKASWRWIYAELWKRWRRKPGALECTQIILFQGRRMGNE